MVFGIICSIAVSGTVFADTNTDDNTVTPYSMYYLSGSLGFSAGNNSVAVIVSTSAFTVADKIYHDVTIYKNGILYSSKIYSDTKCQTLSTQIDVPVTSGDVVVVYVDHYTYHNGVTESGHNERSYMH